MVGSESRYEAWLSQRERDGLLRGLTAMATRDARTISVGSRSFVNFASNDYLGLRFHPALTDRAAEWARRYGAGAGASRLVTGNLDLFTLIEAKVAALKGKPTALLMASGFQANAAVLQALLDRTVLGAEPLVFGDRLNHASMYFGCRAAGVEQIRYRHCDAAHLRDLLARHGDEERPKFILTESVFSMDGDVAPLAALGALAREHSACLIVDDAHATGILGLNGAGMSGDADIAIGTFSKALGGFGAYVACTTLIREYLVNRCSGLIYSTALPPSVLGAIDASLDLIPEMEGDRAYVAQLAEHFRVQANARGHDTGASTTQIVPILVGGNQAALDLSRALRAAGFWATAIRPPTVPAGTARVRLAFTRAHQESDIVRLLAELGEAGAFQPAAASAQ